MSALLFTVLLLWLTFAVCHPAGRGIGLPSGSQLQLTGHPKKLHQSEGKGEHRMLVGERATLCWDQPQWMRTAEGHPPRCMECGLHQGRDSFTGEGQTGVEEEEGTCLTVAGVVRWILRGIKVHGRCGCSTGDARVGQGPLYGLLTAPAQAPMKAIGHPHVCVSSFRTEVTRRLRLRRQHKGKWRCHEAACEGAAVDC